MVNSEVKALKPPEHCNKITPPFHVQQKEKTWKQRIVYLNVFLNFKLTHLKELNKMQSNLHLSNRNYCSNEKHTVTRTGLGYTAKGLNILELKILIFKNVLCQFVIIYSITITWQTLSTIIYQILVISGEKSKKYWKFITLWRNVMEIYDHKDMLRVFALLFISLHVYPNYLQEKYICLYCCSWMHTGVQN